MPKRMMIYQILVLTTLSILLASCVSTQIKEAVLKDAKLELDSLKAVTGSAVGVAGAPGRFWQLTHVFLAKGNENIYLELTNDLHPATRVMGAYCLIHADVKKYQQILDKLIKDKTEIDYMPGGCIIYREQVGQIVTDIIKDPNILGFFESKQD